MSSEPMTSGEFLDLSRFRLDRELIEKLDEAYCMQKQVVLLGPEYGAESSVICLGMIDPSDEKTAFEVGTKINQKIQPVQLNLYELERAVAYGFPDGEPATESTGAARSAHPPLSLERSRTIRFGPDQTAEDMVADMLSEAVTRRASDIHIETYEHDVDVRFRIDGILCQVSTPISPASVRKICSFLRILSDLDITESRIAQDGRVAATYRDENETTRQIDLRVSVLPGAFGHDLVLRVLDENRIALGVDQLGMDDACLKQWSRLIHATDGLIIIAGPTASGKTTTLYSAIREINTDQNKILTVEDPIEYRLPRVSQKQVSGTMSFADYARAFMRQDPDILMIGEVRDEETAQLALRAAKMGHLVFTTLHANDAFAAISRLALLGIDRADVASVLSGVLSQRLVRKVCENCRQPSEPTPEILSALPGGPGCVQWFDGAGCEVCDNSGYHGQIGVFELLALDAPLREFIGAGADMTQVDAPGFVPMIQDALTKAMTGITTAEELLRVIPPSVE